MRPRPSEIITGIRSVLAETIEPELTSGHARSRLSEIRAVLAQVDWDDAGFQLKSRTSVLAERLAEADLWVGGALPNGPVEESFDAYQAYWEHLSALAVTSIERLTVHLDEHPKDDVARAVFERLLDAG
jgi:ribosomal protein S15P/S13E